MTETTLEIYNELGEIIETLVYSDSIKHICINKFQHISSNQTLINNKYELHILKNLDKFEKTGKYYYSAYYNKKFPTTWLTTLPKLGVNEKLPFNKDTPATLDDVYNTSDKLCNESCGLNVNTINNPLITSCDRLSQSLLGQGLFAGDAPGTGINLWNLSDSSYGLNKAIQICDKYSETSSLDNNNYNCEYRCSDETGYKVPCKWTTNENFPGGCFSRSGLTGNCCNTSSL